MLLVFGSGFLTDVTGEALATLAGSAPPWVPGDPAGPPPPAGPTPPARDSLKKKKKKEKKRKKEISITQIREQIKWIGYIS